MGGKEFTRFECPGYYISHDVVFSRDVMGNQAGRRLSVNAEADGAEKVAGNGRDGVSHLAGPDYCGHVVTEGG